MRSLTLMAAMLLCSGFVVPPRSAWQAFAQEASATVAGRAIRGEVVDDGGLPISDAAVEEYSWNGQFLLAATRTDRDGQFSLIPGAPVRIHYLRVSALGFDPLQVRVDQRRKAGTLRLRLRASS